MEQDEWPRAKHQALRAEEQLVDALRRHLHPLAGTPGDHDELLRLIGAARFALLGEASHGTREFYRERISITRRLIVEKGFTAIAVEADWPDAWRVNRYVRGLPGRRRRGAGALRLPALSRLDVAQHRGARLRRVAAGIQP